MKNKLRRFSAKYVMIAFAGILIAVPTVLFGLFIIYHTFNLPDLRNAVHWVYNWVNQFMIYYPWFYFLPPLALIAIAVSYLLTMRSAKRLDAIHNAVLQLQKGEYHVLLPNDNSDAFGMLERNLNLLAFQIGDTLRQQRETERSKDDFIVNIAHDLRTPLTSIIGYLSFISEKELDAEISEKYASIALEKSRQLERLIESLFEIAHLTMDAIAVNKEELSLKRFLMQKQDEMYPQLHAAGMEIRLMLSDSAPTILADGELLARVFDNLINNAICYAKEGRYIDIESQTLPEQVRISFITHANPIPADELDKVFDKLHRLDKSRSAGTGGTGLGLSISRRIVELHGGTLTARHAGSGTAFDIILPK